MPKITVVKIGDKASFPLPKHFGFIREKATENGLIVIPVPADKHGFFLSDTELRELGYYRKEPIKKS